MWTVTRGKDEGKRNLEKEQLTQGHTFHKPKHSSSHIKIFNFLKNGTQIDAILLTFSKRTKTSNTNS